MRVVIDTNVLVAGLRSRRGASFRVIDQLGSPLFQPIISPPVCLEYEDVLSRPDLLPGFTSQDIGDFLDYFLSVSIECRIYFLWRPYLHDPKDDSLLELALAGGAPFIITHNTRDFAGIQPLGIRPVTPDNFLSNVLQQ
jgi:putative PIN family toxin of toxin-antitoxin system